MWKHKIQELLKSYKNKHLVQASCVIDKSVCIYCGDIDAYVEVAEKESQRKKQVYESENGIMKFPYDCCIFEYVETRYPKYLTNVSVLLYKNGEYSYKVITFYFDKHSNRWECCTVYGIIEKNDSDILKLYNIETDESISSQIEEGFNETLFLTSNSIVHAVLTVLECKNVYTKTIVPSDKINKKRRLKNKLPLLDYKILVVNCGTTIKKYISSKNQSYQGLFRVHLCRGHFKEYTKENPLFGKYIGKFWWQPMVRGEKKRGIINKDYSLKVS